MGRSDKKFCDAYCRNAYNNQHKAVDEQYIQLVNSRIRHNRRILKGLSPEGKATVRKEVLDQMGYDYKYFSGIFKTKTGLYYLVYDYAFSPLVEMGIEKALIVQRQNYMDRLTLDIWKNKSQT
ncbi:MAG: hypothetical protein RIG77_17455 [Cyclobacteriaceae bacterium]